MPQRRRVRVDAATLGPNESGRRGSLGGMTHRPAVLSLLGLCLCLLSCGGPGAQSPSTHDSSVTVINTIVIAFTGDPDQLPFNPRAARLQAATQQLTAIAGHPVTFQFDMALLPQWRSSFENALVEAIENVARDLDSMKSRRPDLYAFSDPALERVECRYTAVPVDDDLVFDGDHKTLRIALTSEASAFVGEGWVLRAVDNGYFHFLEKRYAGAQPEQVDDPARYFRYLTDYRRSDSDTESRAETLTLVARTFPRLKDEPHADAQKWLAEKVGFFVDQYRTPLTTGPKFHAAESAWVAWLNANVDALDDRQRDDVVRDLAVERRDRRPGQTHYRQDAFPGFDLIGYGLHVLDQWVAAGHPMSNEAHPSGFLTFIYFVCPAPRDSTGGHSSSFSCDHVLYDYAADSEGGLKRLIAYLLSHKDPLLVETTIMNFIELHDDYAALLAVWRSLEGQPALWEIATRLVAEQVRQVQDKDALLNEAQRQWRAMPSERGSVLYLLSQLENEHYGLVPWKDFPRLFGELANASDFAGMLDQSDQAFWNAHEVWPALSRGWSRAAPLVSRLDAFMDRWRAFSMASQAIDAVGRIVSKMCDEKGAGDLAQLHAWVQRRTAAHASESKDLDPLAFKTAPGKCNDDRD